MSHIIELIVSWAMGLVQHFGYAGIFVTQMLESVLIPIPSEVVLPFGGYLASIGTLNLWLVVIVASAANLVGATIAYYLGHFGGRPLLERYGKYLLIFPSDIQKVDALVMRRGRLVALISRVLPGVRTFSSLIIGSFQIPFGTFLLYTFVGSFIWNLPLAYAGYKVGEHWNFLRPYFHKLEYLIIAAIIILIVVFIRYQLKKMHRQ